MLVIRLKRTGRRGQAHFRLVAQDKRFSPKSGRIVQYLGSYNPHTKVVTFDVEKINKLLSRGAQPSPRVAKLLQKEGTKLPAWVAKPTPKKKAIRNPEKLRKNRPAGAEPSPKTEPTPEAETAAETEPAPEEEKTEDPQSTAEPSAEEAKSEAPPAAEAKAVEESPTKPAEDNHPKTPDRPPSS